MLNFFKKIFFVAAMLLSAFHLEAAGQPVVIEVSEGVMKPIPIAINIFGSTESICKQIYEVIANDLQSTFLFKPISDRAFMQNLRSIETPPQFSQWRLINAKYLLNVDVRVALDDIDVILVLYDVSSETKVAKLTISGSIKNLRTIAHVVANRIYERVTGEKGYFDTKILYVALNKQKNGQKMHRIAIMDQDGFGHRYLTDGRNTVLTPRFAPNCLEFSYFAYKEKFVNGRRIPISASVYRYNLNSGEVSLLVQMNGITYAPRYSPDGKKLIFGLSRGGNSSIWTLDLIDRKLKQLTRGICIDTSPCFSPDGKQIVFNSDRGGTQQLYIMDADGSNIRRLSFSKGRYASPVWSPRGDWIVFTKFYDGRFYIGIIHPDGSGERILASAYLAESPTCSPNGRIIMYSHQTHSKRNKIYSVDITGYNNHEVQTPENAIDPEWSAGIYK